METAKGIKIVLGYYFNNDKVKTAISLNLSDFDLFVEAVDELTVSGNKTLYITDKELKKIDGFALSYMNKKGIVSRVNKSTSLIGRLSSQLNKLEALNNKGLNVYTTVISNNIGRVIETVDILETAINGLNTMLSGLFIVKISVSLNKKKLDTFNLPAIAMASLEEDSKED